MKFEREAKSLLIVIAEEFGIPYSNCARPKPILCAEVALLAVV